MSPAERLLGGLGRGMLAVAITALLVGVVVLIVADGTWQIVGGGLMAVAVTLATAVGFYLVGRSEDRARIRQAAASEQDATLITPRPSTSSKPRRLGERRRAR